jgi:hypothetical protein
MLDWLRRCFLDVDKVSVPNPTNYRIDTMSRQLAIESDAWSRKYRILRFMAVAPHGEYWLAVPDAEDIRHFRKSRICPLDTLALCPSWPARLETSSSGYRFRGIYAKLGEDRKLADWAEAHPDLTMYFAEIVNRESEKELTLKHQTDTIYLSKPPSNPGHELA